MLSIIRKGKSRHQAIIPKKKRRDASEKESPCTIPSLRGGKGRETVLQQKERREMATISNKRFSVGEEKKKKASFLSIWEIK